MNNEERNEAVRHIEISMESARERVELMKALDRLWDNPDFKKVILNDYMKEEPARLVTLRAAPQMADPERQDSLLRALDSIGYLDLHFNSIRQMGMMAENEIDASRDQVSQLEALELES